MKKVENVDQLEFEWVPKDANDAVAFELAKGKGLVTGKKVELWFTVKYPMIARPEYAQIKGWDPLFNPEDKMNSAGNVSATTVPAKAKVIANQVTALEDRLALRENGKVMTLEDVQGQYLIGYITWLFM